MIREKRKSTKLAVKERIFQTENTSNFETYLHGCKIYHLAKNKKTEQDET